MTQVGQDTLATRSTMTVAGRPFAYYSLKKAGAKLGDVSRLPFSMKVLLENLLRFEDGGFTVSPPTSRRWSIGKRTPGNRRTKSSTALRAC